MAVLNKMIGNYLVQQNNNFPLDCETLDYLQTNQHMAEMIGVIAGNKIILSGCDISGSTRQAGYVFVKTIDFPNGEVLRFEGGDASHTAMYLKKESINVVANTAVFSNAYTKRTLCAGTGSEPFYWSEFVGLSDKTNRQLLAEIETLRTQIASLQPAPVGSVIMWVSTTIMPEGWHECDGSSYSKTAESGKYAPLFNVLGYTFGGSGDTFKIPNMQGRFPVGYHQSDYELHQPGSGEDGQESVVLTVDQMPRHNHNTATSISDGNITTSSDGAHSHSIPTGGSTTGVAGGAQKGKNEYAAFNSGSAPDHTHTVPLKARGNNQAHENRPPFFVVKYIIKVQ